MCFVFDQQMAWEAPVHCSKYTTAMQYHRLGIIHKLCNAKREERGVCHDIRLGHRRYEANYIIKGKLVMNINENNHLKIETQNQPEPGHKGSL